MEKQTYAISDKFQVGLRKSRYGAILYGIDLRGKSWDIAELTNYSLSLFNGIPMSTCWPLNCAIDGRGQIEVEGWGLQLKPI